MVQLLDFEIKILLMHVQMERLFNLKNHRSEELPANFCAGFFERIISRNIVSHTSTLLFFVALIFL
jgi:hypothetical protein